MTDSVRLAYQFEARTNLGRAAVVGQQSNITGPQWSQYFPLVPRAGSKKVLGVYWQFSIAYTAGAAQAIITNQTVGPTTTPTDTMDGALDQEQIAPAPNTQARSYITTRLAAEELERISLNVRGFSYPRAAPAAFGGAGTRTDTVFLYTPVGGDAAAARVHVPNVTQVYAANVTALVTITAYAVSGDNDTVVTANEKQTGSLGLGRNDLSLYYPADMAPDFVCFLNETTTTITTLYVTAADGTILADLQDAGLIGQVQSATVAPDTTFTYNDLVFAMDRKRFLTFLFNIGATAGIRDVLFIEYAGGTQVNAPASPAGIPLQPASTNVGAPIGSGQAVAPVGGVGMPASGPLGSAFALSAAKGGTFGTVTPFTRRPR